MPNLKNFCGLKNSTFTVWKGNDFEGCFQLLCLACPANFLLVCSSLLISKRKRLGFDLLELSPSYVFTKVYALISLLICLELIIEVSCSWLLESYNLPVYLLSSSMAAFAWILNAFASWRNRHHLLFRKCYPSIHVMIVVITCLTTAVQVYSVILRARSIGFNSLRVDEYGTISRMSLQVLLIMFLILFCFGVHRGSILNTVNISATMKSTGIQDSSEREVLLRSTSGATFYSGIQCLTDDLGVAEDESNFLSKLTFWWVRPLLLKGYHGNLQSPEDVFLLPRSLNTSKIKCLFSNELYCLDLVTGVEDDLLESSTSDSSYRAIKYLPGLQRGASYQKCERNSSVRRTTSDSSCGMKHGEKNKDNAILVSRDPTRQRSLLKALHHSFGVQYYCVGVLKLTGDGLSFAGPLLLHALVSFMENRQVMYWYCIC